jgi:competence protein ComEC
MRSVCWAAMVVLLFSPESLVGPGFQMSFAAVTALIAAYGWASDRRRADIERHRHRGIIGKGVRYFGGVMLTTLIAGLATSPFAVYHFQHVAVLGLIKNAIALPIAALWVMTAAVITMVSMPFGLDGVPLWIMFQGIDLILASATWIAALPGAAADVAAPSILSLCLVTVGGLCLTLWKQNWRVFGLPVFVLGLMGPLYTKKLDIVIDGDARIVAVSGLEHDLIMSSSRRARFEAATWQRRMGYSVKLKAWARDGEVIKDGLRCDDNGCIYEKRDVRVSILLNKSTLTEDCAQKDLVIALVPIRTPCQTRWGSIDRFDL